MPRRLCFGPSFALAIAVLAGYLRCMLLPRLRAAAQQLPELRANLAELQKIESNRKITLEGNGDAIASTVSAETRSSYRRIGLRLAVSGEYQYEGILKLLGAIETAAAAARCRQLSRHATIGRPSRCAGRQRGSIPFSKSMGFVPRVICRGAK